MSSRAVSFGRVEALGIQLERRIDCGGFLAISGSQMMEQLKRHPRLASILRPVRDSDIVGHLNPLSVGTPTPTVAEAGGVSNAPGRGPEA